MRFPAPYSPAGSSSRGVSSGTRPTTVRGTTGGTSAGRPVAGTGTGSGATSIGRPAGTPGGSSVRGVDRYRGAVDRALSPGRGVTGPARGTTASPTNDGVRGVGGVGSGSAGPRGGVGGGRPARPDAAGGPSSRPGGGKGKLLSAEGREVTPTRYASGPVTRLDTPRPARPTTGSSISGATSVRPGDGVPGSSGRGGGGGKGKLFRASQEGLRKLKFENARAATAVQSAGAVIGYAGNTALGVGLAATGIYATPYLGNSGYWNGYWSGGYYACPPSYYSPWGYSNYGYSWSFALTFNLGWPCSNWFWPTYLSCWYPLWYNCYRPYAPAYYTYASPVYETVVYRTIYEDEYVGAPAPQEPAPVVRETPSSTEIAAERYLTLGDRAFREGRYTDAVQLYAKAIELSPEEGSLYLVLADALFAAGDYHYGAYAIRRGLELDPLLADVVVDKHDFYDEPRSFDRQLAVLEQYVIDHPTDRDARLVLALNYHFGGRPAAAVDLLEDRSSAGLAGDAAAERILEAARRVQFGVGQGAEGGEQ